jgi:VIT1/CCC1 family predicted Fe2+/Mn2+ transporter
MDSARKYREHWQEEVDSVAQYRELARLAHLADDERTGKVFDGLARTEESHVAFWEERMRRLGGEVGTRRPSWRARVLMWLARNVGPQFVLPTIAAGEAANRDIYKDQPETRGTPMSSQERWHARVLNQVVKSRTHGALGGFLGKLEGRHRAVGGNALRASVLGANDGLCSNLSLVMGAAGAAVSSRQLLVTGVAGMLAGAFSMAIGEWLSVTSARELAERELRIEAEELAENPQGEAQELQLIYEAKGMNTEETHTLAQRLVADTPKALDALSREELGIDPDDLGGSAWEAAAASFVLFALGAIIPVAPLWLAPSGQAVYFSVTAGSLGLFATGAATSVFTGQPVWRSGLRQLGLGLAAAGLTFVLGRMIGVNI